MDDADEHKVQALEQEISQDEILSVCNDTMEIIGGCCGTTPEHISALSEEIKKL
ncbi:MAG: homocysteine S-methyltransferase family protein [Bacteroidetes bacterium]|nr:homocysteine S-methyltransferase family protein [Bacteroidota bacterium]MBU1115217.1 homocysteine S-methyltransferase family protein [Bacteroidota bacterium]MBU1797235.1 homocysteine S-methyltransferase family protein [Bacteroidota bacterium]